MWCCCLLFFLSRGFCDWLTTTNTHNKQISLLHHHVHRVLRNLPHICAFLRVHGRHCRTLLRQLVFLFVCLLLCCGHEVLRFPSHSLLFYFISYLFIYFPPTHLLFLLLIFIVIVVILLLLLDIGAAYGTAKSGVGISSMGVMNPGLVMRCIIPVVMAGVLGIYGLIVAVIIQGSSESFFI